MQSYVMPLKVYGLINLRAMAKRWHLTLPKLANNQLA